MQAVTRWGYRDFDGGAIGWRGQKSFPTGVESSGGQFLAGTYFQTNFFTGVIDQGVTHWVKVEATSDSQCHHRFRRGDERVRGGVTIISLWKVPVVARDYGVGDPVWQILTVPLADTRSTGVCQDLCT